MTLGPYATWPGPRLTSEGQALIVAYLSRYPRPAFLLARVPRYRWIWHRYASALQHDHELHQEALYGVTRAALTYDPSLPSAPTFDTYATNGVLLACRKWVQSQRQSSALPADLSDNGRSSAKAEYSDLSGILDDLRDDGSLMDLEHEILSLQMAGCNHDEITNRTGLSPESASFHTCNAQSKIRNRLRGAL